MTVPEPIQAAVPRPLRSLLAIPLAGKLAGANAIIAVVAIVVGVAGHGSGAGDQRMVVILTASLFAALFINLLLVRVALRPLRQIEDIVQRVTGGELGARVPGSMLADRNIARVGTTLNALLDVLTEDRERMRALAGRVIAAGDTERANMARTLHDSAAQSLAALAFQTSAAANESSDPAMKDRLATIRDLSVAVLDEVRLLGQTLYPQSLDNLGLETALKGLARQVGESEPGVDITVKVEDARVSERLPIRIASVLYQVAREGLTNALRHGDPRAIDLEVAVEGDNARLTVVDDGCGFDVTSAERDVSGTGLFGIRQRLALVNGEVTIDSKKGTGTRLSVTVPLATVRS